MSVANINESWLNAVALQAFVARRARLDHYLSAALCRAKRLQRTTCRPRRSSAECLHMAGPVMLIIRDGWGINPGDKEKREENSDATLLARTPFHDQLYRDYPGAKLSASGADVGLPDGQMGNSEVGHLNLGAGRIVYQDLTRINEAIADGELARNDVAQEAFAAAREHRLHLLGLVSEGGVHSHYSHMIALANAACAAGVREILVHGFTDGRDSSPTGGREYL